RSILGGYAECRLYCLSRGPLLHHGALEKGIAVHARTPLVISIDVEPDDRLVHPSARPRWTGFETMLPEMQRIRGQLTQAIGAPVQFTWLFRIDHQVEQAYGRADWGLQEYRREIADLTAQG